MRNSAAHFQSPTPLAHLYHMAPVVYAENGFDLVMRLLLALVIVSIPLLGNDVVFLHGQVNLEDGSAPGKSVSIMLRCNGNDPVRQTNTGKNGSFYLKVERDEFNHIARALPTTTTDVGDAGLAGNCFLAADLKGYDSTSIDLSSFVIGKDLKLPKLVLKPHR